MNNTDIKREIIRRQGWYGSDDNYNGLVFLGPLVDIDYFSPDPAWEDETPPITEEEYMEKQFGKDFNLDQCLEIRKDIIELLGYDDELFSEVTKRMGGNDSLMKENRDFFKHMLSTLDKHVAVRKQNGERELTLSELEAQLNNAESKPHD